MVGTRREGGQYWWDGQQYGMRKMDFTEWKWEGGGQHQQGMGAVVGNSKVPGMWDQQQGMVVKGKTANCPTMITYACRAIQIHPTACFYFHQQQIAITHCRH
jgi:hypothetical protein